MKKLLWIVLAIALMLCGCGKGSNGNPDKNVPFVVPTKFFTLEAPASWKDDCSYECKETAGGGLTLTFREKKSYESGLGGLLFSVKVMPAGEDFTVLPNYDPLGRITNEEGKVYNIILLCPTGTEYSEETQAKYAEMEKDIPGILESIYYNWDYEFSPIPIMP